MTTGIWLASAAVLVAVVVGVALGVRRRSALDLDRETARADKAEAALDTHERSSQDQRAAQDLILSAMEEGIMLFDKDGRTAFANAPVARHLGSSPADLGALLPLELQKAARRSAFSGSSSRLEVETGTPNRWLRASCTPIGDEGSLLVVVRDVTEARRLDAIRRDFVANASHELKTPAASIQAAAETLVQVAEDDPGAVVRFATHLDREARRMSRIVEDLLDLSRLESGSERDGRVRLDIVLRDEADRLRESAATAEVSLDIEGGSAPAIKGSSRDLALLVRNLLDNAVNYTKAGGRVTAAVTHDDRLVVLKVSDTGIGIPSRDLPRIFERFFRVDRARSRETGGTGLGLAIVKHVAENHGGSVEAESELGRGTTFTVQLPMLET